MEQYEVIYNCKTKEKTIVKKESKIEDSYKNSAITLTLEERVEKLENIIKILTNGEYEI